jgi:hypothetical protein
LSFVIVCQKGFEMHRRIFISFFLLALFACATVQAQDRPGKMPQEDVVEIPAIGKGLCVSNVFQTDMVLQRNKPLTIWGWADYRTGSPITNGESKDWQTRAIRCRQTAGPQVICAQAQWPTGTDPATGNAEAVFEPRWGESAKTRSHAMAAVPYYAWANRGEGYMDVWLPRTPELATPLPAQTAGETATVSASAERPARQLAALTDRRSGPKSNFRPTPRFTWPTQTQGVQWVRYEWPQPRELSRTAIYWAVDQKKQVYWGERIRGANLKLPKSWSILYKDGSTWRPVESVDPFTMHLDRPNEIRFTPVKATAVRLEVVFADAPCSIQEWLID